MAFIAETLEMVGGQNSHVEKRQCDLRRRSMKQDRGTSQKLWKVTTRLVFSSRFASVCLLMFMFLRERTTRGFRRMRVCMCV